jgi:serine/threonine transporter
MPNPVWKALGSTQVQCALALLLALALSALKPSWAAAAAPAGDAFVLLLKAAAPAVTAAAVFRAASSAPQRGRRMPSGFVTALFLFSVSMLAAAAVSAALFTIFPIAMPLAGEAAEPMEGGGSKLFLDALLAALFGALALGILLRKRFPKAKALALRVCDAAERAVRFALRFLPIGLFGMICGLFSSFERPEGCLAQLMLLLLAGTLASGLAINPLIFWAACRRNPLPPLGKCLAGSALFALLSRSSLANLPINMALAERAGLPRDLCALTLPLGASFNMPGAAVTLAGMAVFAVHSAGGALTPALAAAIVPAAALCAVGAAGMPNGSAVLLSAMFSLCGIAPGQQALLISAYFIADLLQDAAGTALNSSSDVYFTWAAALRAKDVSERP